MEGEGLKNGVTTWQWITLIGVIMTTGVGVTVFAFQTFEARGASALVEDKLERKLRRIEWKQDQMMIHFRIPTEPPAYRGPAGEEE